MGSIPVVSTSSDLFVLTSLNIVMGNGETLVKITGKIAGFNTEGAELMLSPEIENVTLEVVK